jgi:hypothetical protein
MGRKAQQVTQGVIEGIVKSAAKHGASEVVIDLGNGASARVSMKATQPSTVTVLENDEWKVAS